MEIGCIAFLRKPFSAETLMEVLSTLPRRSLSGPRK
jgi:FixJ family two-component response regulator